MKYKLIALLSTMAFVAPVGAAVVVDQNQENYNFAYGNPTIAQTFKQSANNIAGAGFLFQYLRGHVEFSLWNGLPTQGGQLLISQSFENSQGATMFWLDFMWDPIEIDPSATYVLQLDYRYGDAAPMADGPNPYLDGQVYVSPEYAPFVNSDLAFRTYAEVTTAAIPEPSTWAMMIGGFALAGSAMRRRKTSIRYLAA